MIEKQTFVYVCPVFIRSKFGGILLSIGGFTFCKHRNTKYKTHWKCATHCGKHCKAKVFTLDETNEVIKCYNVHNHPMPCNARMVHLKKSCVYEVQVWWYPSVYRWLHFQQAPEISAQDSLELFLACWQEMQGCSFYIGRDQRNHQMLQRSQPSNGVRCKGGTYVTIPYI
ncbi:hypothetical protein evm_005172 [Chilo suppressalis]|nr:hypothetical protein evm_005172 [Chilo suppressalis]